MRAMTARLAILGEDYAGVETQLGALMDGLTERQANSEDTPLVDVLVAAGIADAGDLARVVRLACSTAARSALLWARGFPADRREVVAFASLQDPAQLDVLEWLVERQVQRGSDDAQ